jgi:hypothetical protein
MVRAEPQLQTSYIFLLKKTLLPIQSQLNLAHFTPSYLLPVQSRSNPAHTNPPYFINIRLNIIPHIIYNKDNCVLK